MIILAFTLIALAVSFCYIVYTEGDKRKLKEAAEHCNMYLTNTRNVVANLKTQIQGLDQQIRLHKRVNKELKNTLDAMSSDITDLDTKYGTLKSDFNKLLIDLKNLENQLPKAEDTLEEWVNPAQITMFNTTKPK